MCAAASLSPPQAAAEESITLRRAPYKRERGKNPPFD